MIRNFTTILAALSITGAIAQEVPVAPATSVEAPKTEFKAKGSAYGTIFANYNQKYVGDSMTSNEMVLERAYLGYKNNFAENWTADVKIDVAGATDDSKKRPMYVKEANLKYSKNNLSVTAGIVPTTEVGAQLKHWGNRYILNTATDINKVGVTSADIGVVTDYKINDMFSADFAVYNGEGYGSPQLDQEFVQMLGVTAKLPAGVIVRAFGSYMADTVLRKFGEVKNAETIYGGFLGIKTLEDKLVVGTEYSHASNWKNVSTDKADIISSYATFLITPKIQAFVRYDMANLEKGKLDKTSGNIVTGTGDSNTLILVGGQYMINKNIRVSLDVQQTKKESADDATTGCFIHTEIKF